MPTTRRRKIVRSKAIRRVKPNAKRKERKTQKRKSRNKVMRGGVHEKLKVYVIQKKLGSPKCIIVREKSSPKDTIYLFFDSKLDQTEIKEFVCAAMGLDVSADITPELQFTSPESKEFNNLFVKLSGIVSYSLSSGQLYSSRGPISGISLQKHDTPKISMKNGEAIIESLKSKTDTKQDYTFTEYTQEYYFNIEKFDLGVLERFVYSVMEDTTEKLKTHCSAQPILSKIEELTKMVTQQETLNDSIDIRARIFIQEKRSTTSEITNEHKKITVKEAENSVIDIEKAKKLIAEITSDTSFSQCKGTIEDKIIEYIDGKKEFTPKESIQKMVDDAYSMQRW